MFESTSDLAAAARGARERLAADALAAARINTGGGRDGTERVMAESAQAAIFTEALLNAIKARVGEFKTVTRSQ